MIIDTSLIFSDQQVVAATGPSTNILDLGTTGTAYMGSGPLARNIGHGERIDLSVSVAQAFVGVTSMQVVVQISPDNANWTAVDSGAVIAGAQLTAGYLFAVPQLVQTAKFRYLRLYYIVVGNPTQGTINAAVVASRQNNINCGGY